jgi:hypothetical protein
MLLLPVKALHGLSQVTYPDKGVPWNKDFTTLSLRNTGLLASPRLTLETFCSISTESFRQLFVVVLELVRLIQISTELISRIHHFPCGAEQGQSDGRRSDLLCTETYQHFSRCEQSAPSTGT